MRIAINHTRFSRAGGIERYVFSLVERLLAEGHEVHCFVRRWEPYVHPRLHFHRVPVLPLGEGMKALTFAYASAFLIGRGRFDVVHGFTKTFRQDVYTDGSGCFEDYLAYLRTASLWRRITTYRPLLAFAVRHIERRRFRREPLPRVLALSRMAEREVIARHGFPPDGIEVLYPGVDADHFRPARGDGSREELRRAQGTPPGAVVALLVGNDFRRKGVTTAIEAVAQLRARSVVLWVVGHDRRAARYEALARARGIEARFLGSAPDPAAWFAAADVFLFPSLYDVFGNAALEALSTGLPSVVSALAGVSEILEDGVDGLILEDPGSPGELARLLEKLLDPARREEVGRRARATAETLRLDAHFAKLWRVYDEVSGEALLTRTGRLFSGQRGDAPGKSP